MCKMIFLPSLYILCLPFVQSYIYDSLSDNSTCQEKILYFGNTVSKFTNCSITHSQPITFCENCVVDYINSVNGHTDIVEGADINGTCKSRWIDLDRLQLVESAYQNVLNLWERAHCKKCFDWVDNATHPYLSNDTQLFSKLFTETIHCIKKYNQSEAFTNLRDGPLNQKLVCIKCKDMYLNLNKLYESMKLKEEDICMDVVDLMNKTRNIWSSNLNCWERGNNPEVAFYCSSAFVATLPLLFYILIKFYNRNI